MKGSKPMIFERNKVHIVSTGGTIEKIYDERSGFLGNRESVVEKIIASELRLPFLKIKYHQLMAKDSLDMTERDREIILDFVKIISAKEEPVIVLHGTDTLQRTVSFFEESGGVAKKAPILFTGAMKPIGFLQSDALQNITEALTLARVLPPGLYVTFHNQVLEGSQFKKNYELGTFEKIS